MAFEGFDSVRVRAVKAAIINDRLDDWDAIRCRGGSGFDLKGVDGVTTILGAITWNRSMICRINSAFSSRPNGMSCSAFKTNGIV